MVSEGFLDVIMTEINQMHKVNRKLATRVQKSLHKIGIKVNSEK